MGFTAILWRKGFVSVPSFHFVLTSVLSSHIYLEEVSRVHSLDIFRQVPLTATVTYSVVSAVNNDLAKHGIVVVAEGRLHFQPSFRGSCKLLHL